MALDFYKGCKTMIWNYLSLKKQTTYIIIIKQNWHKSYVKDKFTYLWVENKYLLDYYHSCVKTKHTITYYLIKGVEIFEKWILRNGLSGAICLQ